MRPCLLLPLICASLSAQNFVEGHVVDAVTGLPVAGAYVRGGYEIQGDPLPITDAAGHFRIEVKGKTLYSWVSRNGYVDFTRQLSVKPESIRVVLTPAAAISGRVVDENGLPVYGARVSALQYITENGQRRLRARKLSETNESGEYRLFGLTPGRYYLSFEPRNFANWDPGYGPRYYPDTQEADKAEALDLQAGEERGGRDFPLRRQPGVTISGHLVWPDGFVQKGSKLPRLANLFLQSTSYLGYSVPVAHSSSSFSIAHVPPGNYTLRSWQGALQPQIGDPMADMALQVSDIDLHDVSLEIHSIEPQDISGIIVFQGNTKRGPMTVTLQSGYGRFTSVLSNPDGSFVVKGVLPGSYSLEALSTLVEGQPKSNGNLIATELGGREVRPMNFQVGTAPAGLLKITVAALAGKITGKFVDAAGRPISGAWLGFVPRDGKQPSYAQTDTDGTFIASVWATGQHQIFVVSTQDEFDALRDPDFLQANRSDYPPVTIAEGDNPPLLIHKPAQ